MENLRSPELLIQVLLVGAGVTLAWQILDLWQLPLWFLACYGLIGLEKIWHAQPLKDVSLRSYMAHLAMSFLIAATASLLPVFLWLHGGALFHFGTMAYLVGATLNTFLVRAKAWPVLLCYLVPNSMVFFVIALDFAADTPSSAEPVIALSIAAFISLYFPVTVADAIRRHRAHITAVEELYHARKIEAVGNLAGGVAHDFNNLLGVVSGNLELLQSAKTEEERRALVAQALIATGRGAALTRQLLALGRQAPPAPEETDVGQLLEEFKSILTRLLPENIEVHTRCDPDVSRAWLDPNALHATLLNLALNARDAMTGPGVLSIEASRVTIPPVGKSVTSGELRAGEHLRLRVRDTGEGIAPDVLGRVLEPFFTTKAVGKGSGLGLSMVVGFAQQSDGGVKITSTPGQGTSISIYLPYQAPEPNAPGSSQAVDEEARSTARATSLLLVEDETPLRRVVEKQLMAEGFDVTAFATADEALQAVEAGLCPDIVLSDVVMPGTLQGPELIGALRARLPAARFVLMTGYSNASELDLPSRDLGFSMITKPFKLRELSEHLRGGNTP